ncbi:hypothetical protein F8O01_02865 [Pseudoclavibacter chungangensis]|uniref:Uncharacterized protein n=1 Tax=Pseudoclavibacter chungangensis TaxID=587635 RepID=A0A7J5C046_9MICO|nr:hypothetical protein [Pseudoclavibacter chungangensis]KAB1660287.1 hypothetical protein F8O01_02865 [Pseudoclavibacter chungangensis]NYJ65635.1 hypothetical protein [Pseudoclavibacter chungangensis]
MLESGDPGLVLLIVAAVAVITTLLVGYGVIAYLSRRTRDANFWQESSPVSTIERRQARTTLDRLRAACDEAGIAAPRPTVLSLTDTMATVFLDRPAETAPEPWAVSPDGLTWQALLDELDVRAFAAPEHRLPDAVVALGRTSIATVFVDLAACPGVVNVVGNRQLARKLVRRWIGELTQPTWRVDFTAGVIEDASLLTGRSMRWNRSIRPDAGRDFRGGYLAVGTANDADVVEAMVLSSRHDDQRGAAGVVIGSMRQAAWRIHVGPYGVLTSSVLPTTDMRDPFIPFIAKQKNRLAGSVPWRAGAGRVDVVPSSLGHGAVQVAADPDGGDAFAAPDAAIAHESESPVDIAIEAEPEPAVASTSVPETVRADAPTEAGASAVTDGPAATDGPVAGATTETTEAAPATVSAELPVSADVTVSADEPVSADVPVSADEPVPGAADVPVAADGREATSWPATPNAIEPESVLPNAMQVEHDPVSATEPAEEEDVETGTGASPEPIPAADMETQLPAPSDDGAVNEPGHGQVSPASPGTPAPAPAVNGLPGGDRPDAANRVAPASADRAGTTPLGGTVWPWGQAASPWPGATPVDERTTPTRPVSVIDRRVPTADDRTEVDRTEDEST